MTGKIRTKIAGVGAYAPEKVLDNAWFEARIDTSDEWIIERTGIRQRRMLAPDQATSDMCAAAGAEAIKNAGLEPKDIDIVVIGTVTPDTFFPTASIYAAKKIGIPGGVPAFDVLGACCGFLYALGVGKSFIESGAYKNVLVCGSESLTRITNYSDRNTCVLFGDAAGAVVLNASTDESGIYSVHLFSEEAEHLLSQPGGGSRNPASHETVEKAMHFIYMKGRDIFKIAVPKFVELADLELRENHYKTEDVKLFIPHQVNLRIIEAFAKRAGIPMDKIMINLDRYGNTSSASIPLALKEAIQTGRAKRGDLLHFSAVGAGLTWASALVRL
jgi:3-oxoacyl-[acyl-carrier-protein] synthase-3